MPGSPRVGPLPRFEPVFASKPGLRSSGRGYPTGLTMSEPPQQWLSTLTSRDRRVVPAVQRLHPANATEPGYPRAARQLPPGWGGLPPGRTGGNPPQAEETRPPPNHRKPGHHPSPGPKRTTHPHSRAQHRSPGEPPRRSPVAGCSAAGVLQSASGRTLRYPCPRQPIGLALRTRVITTKLWER